MIYHIAQAPDWDAALEAGEYRTSTLGRTLEEDEGEGVVYGPIALAAVVMNTPLPRDAEGRLELPSLP